jgi:hypothetical protein
MMELLLGRSLGLTLATSKAACGTEEHGSGAAADGGADAISAWARGAASAAASSRRILRRSIGACHFIEGTRVHIIRRIGSGIARFILHWVTSLSTKQEGLPNCL